MEEYQTFVTTLKKLLKIIKLDFVDIDKHLLYKN